MTIDPMKSFEIPADMRKFAEQSVEQARQAFDSFMSVANKTVGDIEDRANAARSGAKDVSAQAVTFAQRNIASSFDFAQKLVQARSVEDVLKIQQDYIQTQMQALNEQAKAMGEAASKATQTAAKPQ